MAELTIFGVGVATADPELRHVGQRSVSICTVNLAFNRNYQDNNEQWQTESCFVRAQIWGNRAEKMAELVKKGQPIYVCGYLKQDSWSTNDGQKRIAYSISLKDFQLCERNSQKQFNNQCESKSVSSLHDSPPIEADDAIPF